MPDYAAMKVEAPKLKAALTRARKEGPVEVLETVADAFDRFNTIGWPDTWHTWNIAALDAESELRYGRTELDDEQRERALKAVARLENTRW